MQNSNLKDLKKFIESNVIKNMKKVRGKHAPITELVENTSYSLSVKSIYDMKPKFKNFFLFITKNYSKHPKFRFFIAIILANHSSDLLVILARDYALKNELKLIQYSIFPKNIRVQLLSIKEIKNVNTFASSIEILNDFRQRFRNRLVKLKKSIENE
ncbi:MAG: hypothetical protein ACFFHD_11170 [Promethearchaeota archaeon]